MKAGWVTRKLGELLEVQNGYAFSSKDYAESGSFLMRIGNVQNGFISPTDPRFIQLAPESPLQRFKLAEDDILVSLTGNVGRVGIILKEHLPAVLNQRVARINIRDDSIAIRGFLLFFLFSDWFREELTGAGHGAAQQNVSTKDLIDIQISVAPLSEQQRIVTLLDEAFDGIATAKANAEKNLQNARAIFESYLTSVYSTRNAGWIDKPLHTLCRRITVGHVGSMANLYKPTGIPFLRSQNIRPFLISMENMVFIDEEFHAALGKSSLQAGDLAIVRTGYPGTAAVIPDSLGVANCSDLVIVRPGPEIDAHFLAAFFNSSFGKNMVSGKVVGAAQKHFNVGAAKDVLLHLPPLVEQQQIVAATNLLREETQRLESIYKQKLTALDEVKKSLLHRAFNGDL